MLIQYRSAGITGTVSWSTLNAINGKIELDGTLAKDLKVETTGTFKPDTQDTQSKINFYFKQPAFHLRGFIDALKGPVVTSDFVVGYEGFVAGAEASYSVPQAALSRYSASVGYLTSQYSTALTATNNAQVFSTSFYQKVSSAVEAGAKATYDTKAQGTVGLELAGKYRIDPLAFVKVSGMRNTLVRVPEANVLVCDRARSTTRDSRLCPTTTKSEKASRLVSVLHLIPRSSMTLLTRCA